MIQLLDGPKAGAIAGASLRVERLFGRKLVTVTDLVEH